MLFRSRETAVTTTTETRVNGNVVDRTTSTAFGNAFASTDGEVLSINAGGNYYLNKNQPNSGIFTTLTSFLAYSETEVDPYVETGDQPGALLGFERSTIDSLILSLGVQVFKPISTSRGVFTPTAQVDWNREFEDDPVTVISFPLDPSVSSTVSASSREIDEDWYRAVLGLIFTGPRGYSGFFTVDWDFDRDDLDRTKYTLGIRKELGPR